jgi:hypothetical protein
MKLMAQRVLEDCELSLDDFLAAGVSLNWRARWVGLVALLRAVGHVFTKVDIDQRNLSLKSVADQVWARHKVKPIFKDFIEQERNNTLKAYEINPVVNTDVLQGATFVTDPRGSNAGAQPEYKVFLQSGIYQNRNVEGVCREAIEFWRTFLNDFEAQASAAISLNP